MITFLSFINLMENIKFFYFIKLTVKTIHEFSFTAPQHPRNAMTKTTDPTTIINIGADQKLAPIY